MIKISDLLGKPLISLFDAKAVGFISNVWFDSKLVAAKTAEITSDDDEFPERSYTQIRYMECDGDAAVIKSLAGVTSLNSSVATVSSPINRRAFNQNGKDLGTVRDVILENNRTQKIICEKAEFTPKELLSLGDNLCIFNDTGKPIKLARPKVPRPTPKAAETEVNIFSAVQTPRMPQSVTVTKTPGVPVKDYSFLMGKPVRTPVLSGGKILIPAGKIVDEQTIELARRENKLVQLALRAY